MIPVARRVWDSQQSFGVTAMARRMARMVMKKVLRGMSMFKEVGGVGFLFRFKYFVQDPVGLFEGIR